MTPWFNTKTDKVKGTRISDTNDLTSHGILLFSQSTLQEIYKNSGPNAVGNEFQAHYWALVFRHVATDGSFLDIAFPTVFFNYPQQVTSAHIDFEMKDVHAMSEKLRPVHNAQVAKLLKTNLQDRLEVLFKCEFEPVSVNLCNIHRHPGSSNRQGFSGTDLDTNPKEHGIVYPFKKAKDTPSFASIMAVDNGVCNFAHSEYRIANGELDKDLQYVQNRSCAIVNEIPAQSGIEQLLSGKSSLTIRVREKQSLINDGLIEQLSKHLATSVKPLTQFVIPTNVTKKKRVPILAPIGKHPYKAPAKVKKEELVVYSKEDLSDIPREQLLEILVEVDDFFDLDSTEDDYEDFDDSTIIDSIVEGYAEVEVELAKEEVARQNKIKEVTEIEDLLSYADDNVWDTWDENAFFRN